MSRAPWMTWWLVTIRPLSSTTTPLPEPCATRPVAMPNMLSQGLLGSGTKEAVWTWTTASTDASAARTNEVSPAGMAAERGTGQLGAEEEGEWAVRW